MGRGHSPFPHWEETLLPIPTPSAPQSILAHLPLVHPMWPEPDHFWDASAAYGFVRLITRSTQRAQTSAERQHNNAEWFLQCKLAMQL